MTAIDLMLLLTLILPLVPFIVRVLVRVATKQIHSLSIITSAFSLAGSAYLLYQTLVSGPFYRSFIWFSFAGNEIGAGYYLDGLSASMLFVVWIVSLSVQIYSLAYMYGDKRFSDYFAFLSLFTFSMSGLVVSSSLATVFVFWELVGLCSFLLIGFWYERESAINAAIKAFITTRLGDTAFLIGLLVLLSSFGTLDIVDLSHQSAGFSRVVSIASLLIFAGAVGKSAQFPLHVWLPDAMEGPTPVSALIHAATMVAAGVYLIARVQFLFADLSIRSIVLAIGLITALMAALMAVFQRDIKKVLAFSTISQLGYMMASLGAGAFSYGVFHLYTHAFFKALLFLSAGSIFHAIHSLDISDSGGLLRKLKWTGILFLLGALNLAGFPLTGGFFSKDSILYGLQESGYNWAYYLLLLVAFITSFYIFKVFFRVFLGSPGKNFEDAHESPAVMLIPMAVLAVLSFLSGLLAFFSPFGELVHGHFELNEALPSFIASLVGIGVAYVSYGLRKFEFETLKSKAGVYIREFFYNRMFIDDFYMAVFVKGYAYLSKAVDLFDRVVVDGVVNGVSAVSVFLGRKLKPFENGFVQIYLFYTAIFASLIAIWVYMLGGNN